MSALGQKRTSFSTVAMSALRQCGLMQCSKNALRAYGALTRQILRFWGDAGRVCGFADPDRAFRIVFLRRRDHQILRPRRYFAKLANCFCRDADISIRLDMHCSGSPPIATCSAETLLGLYFMWASSLAETASGSAAMRCCPRSEHFGMSGSLFYPQKADITELRHPQLTCGPRISFKAASIPLQVSASSV